MDHEGNMIKKTAIITGIKGQDGSYMKELLEEKGYKVIGIEIDDKVQKSVPSFSKFLEKERPDEIYNFAAQSSAVVSVSEPFLTYEANVGLPLIIYESVRKGLPTCKVFQASSSLIFGNPNSSPQNEETPIVPDSMNPYATAKAYAHQMAHFYRAKYNLFICCGILYNHESERRGIDFVTQKIAYAAACAKKGIEIGDLKNSFGEYLFEDGKVRLGNLDAVRDWGYAPDYVEGIWKMLQYKLPDDYILATGKLHSVEDFCKEAFGSVGLDYKKYVVVDERFVRPNEKVPYVGDARKAKKILKWEAKTPFKEWVGRMVESQLHLH
jgi:GDPmannose 4,6-dehydratase